MWEFQQVCKYVHQILTVVNKLKTRLLIKEDLGWYGRANFVGELLDSVVKGCFKDFPVTEYTYVACFKVAMWFVFALCGLMVFMVY